MIGDISRTPALAPDRPTMLDATPTRHRDRRHGAIWRMIGHLKGSHFIDSEVIDMVPPQLARNIAADRSFEDKLMILRPAEEREPKREVKVSGERLVD